MKIAVREIRGDDCQMLATFLANGLGYEPARFVHIFDVMGQRQILDGYPRYGLLLEAEGRIVGSLLAIYANIEYSTPRYIRCHLTGWYVEPGFRMYGALLAKAATSNPGVCYINTSARPNTHQMIEAQGFRKYSRGKYVVLCPLHLFDYREGASISTHNGAPAHAHEASDVQLMDFHARRGCICLWGALNGRAYPFILRRKNIKRILPTAQVIFCRDISYIDTFAGSLSRNMLKRGISLLSFDANGPVPGLRGVYFDGIEPRFSKGISPSVGDLAFTLDALVPFSRRG